MEYNYVVTWSMENGWHIDWETTQAKFPDGNVYVPNMDDWISGGQEGTETYIFETVITDDLSRVFDAMREKSQG